MTERTSRRDAACRPSRRLAGARAEARRVALLGRLRLVLENLE
jgi:hypothetical protein